MRHRFGYLNGLGNPEDCILDNNITINLKKWKEFINDCCKKYKLFDEFNGFDFHGDRDRFIFGIEPTYKWDKLLIIEFDFNNRENSSIKTGVAFGYYGSSCVCETKKYNEYKRRSKFVQFIDKWYDFIKEEIQEK